MKILVGLVFSPQGLKCITGADFIKTRDHSALNR
jgi:hypothetical protein